MSDHAITTVPLPQRRYVADPNDVECCVCLSPHYEPIRAEPCGHVACHNCLDRLDQCPSCRAHVHSTTPCDEAYTTKCHNTQVSCLSCPWTGTRKQQVTQAHVMCPALCQLQAEEKMTVVMRDVHPTELADEEVSTTVFIDQMMKSYCPNMNLSARTNILYWSTTRHAALQSLSGPSSCLLWTLLDACVSNNTELAVGLALRALAIPPSSPDAFPAGLDWQYVCLLVAASSNRATLGELLRVGLTAPNPPPEVEFDRMMAPVLESPFLANDFECLRILVKNCWVNKYESFQKTIHHGRSRWIRRLVTEMGCGVDEPLRTGSGITTYPLQLALMRSDANCVSELISSGANVDIVLDSDGNTPLHIAVAFSDVECLHMLLSAGANPQVSNADGVTPLMLAAALCKPGHTRALLNMGADVNYITTPTDGRKVTALIMTIMRGNIECLSMLLAAGANTETADSNECTPLILAVTLGKLDLVKALVEAGADVNAIIVDSYEGEMTPLCVAARYGNLDIVKYLHGSSDTRSFVSHHNAVSHALSSTATSVLDYLIGRGYRVSIYDLCLAIKKKNLPAVKLFIQPRLNLKLDATYESGNNPFFEAVALGSCEIINMLFDLGADLTPKLEEDALVKGHSDGVFYLRYLREKKNTTTTTTTNIQNK